MTHKKTPQKKRKRVLELGLILALILMVGGYFGLTVFSGCTYTILDGERTIELRTNSTDTGEILRKAGVELGEKDLVSVSGGSARGRIEIQRAQNVTVNYGNVETKTVTYGGTIGQLLQQLDITLSTSDVMTIEGQAASTAAPTYDGMELDIDRVTLETSREQVSVPYETVSYLDPTLEAGETRVQTSGVAGENQVVKQLKYVNGELVETEITGTYVLREPVNEVLLMGSKATLEEEETALEIYTEPEPEPSPTATQKPQTSGSSGTRTEASAAAATPTPVPTPAPTPAPTPEPSDTPPAASGNTVTTSSGEVLSYSKVLSVTATAYTGGGTTATGTSARYGAIAVDPSVIPYGTRMYIVSDDGKWVYGLATAEDCGGAIKGNIIDLYFDSYDTCIQFGRRACTVYILD